MDQLLADEQLVPVTGGGYDLTSPGNVVWTLTDNENTVRDLATYNAQTGVTAVANHRVYDSFGNLTSQTNAAVDCLFGFTGLPFDKASGTNVTPTRRYDPTTGRWDGPDTDGFGGGDPNLYRYCGNSPTNHVDPSGEFFLGFPSLTDYWRLPHASAGRRQVVPIWSGRGPYRRWWRGSGGRRSGRCRCGGGHGRRGGYSYRRGHHRGFCQGLHYRHTDSRTASAVDCFVR